MCLTSSSLAFFWVGRFFLQKTPPLLRDSDSFRFWGFALGSEAWGLRARLGPRGLAIEGEGLGLQG